LLWSFKLFTCSNNINIIINIYEVDAFFQETVLFTHALMEFQKQEVYV
jgi:hypothetical protein